jgi:hypothetical protein
MKLSKKIPAKIKTVKFLWCKKDFMLMSQKYRDIRSKLKNPMDTCFWCGYKFIDGDMMALAATVTQGNKTLCQSCAELLEEKP